jgi:hypothetical protein
VHVLRDLNKIMDKVTIPHQFDGDDAEPYYPPELTPYCKINTVIRQKFADAVDTPRHFEKVQWFASYWNDTIGFSPKGLTRIKGPGLETSLIMPG